MNGHFELHPSNTDDTITELFYDHGGGDVSLTTDQERYMDLITCGYMALENPENFTLLTKELPQLSVSTWDPCWVKRSWKNISVLLLYVAGIGAIIEWKDIPGLRTDIITVTRAFKLGFPVTLDEITRFINAYNRIKGTALGV